MNYHSSDPFQRNKRGKAIVIIVLCVAVIILVTLWDANPEDNFIAWLLVALSLMVILLAYLYFLVYMNETVKLWFVNRFGRVAWEFFSAFSAIVLLAWWCVLGYTLFYFFG